MALGRIAKAAFGLGRSGIRRIIGSGILVEAGRRSATVLLAVLIRRRLPVDECCRWGGKGVDQRSVRGDGPVSGASDGGWPEAGPSVRPRRTSGFRVDRDDRPCVCRLPVGVGRAVLCQWKVGRVNPGLSGRGPWKGGSRGRVRIHWRVLPRGAQARAAEALPGAATVPARKRACVAGLLRGLSAHRNRRADLGSVGGVAGHRRGDAGIVSQPWRNVRYVCGVDV